MKTGKGPSLGKGSLRDDFVDLGTIAVPDAAEVAAASGRLLASDTDWRLAPAADRSFWAGPDWASVVRAEPGGNAGGPGRGKSGGRKNKDSNPDPEPEPEPEAPQPQPQPDEPEVFPGYDSGAPRAAIDAVTSGASWSVTTINYAFPELTPGYASLQGFAAFSTAQRDATVAVFDLLSQYTGLTFVETGLAQSHIALGTADFGSGAGGYGWYPSAAAQNSMSGDVYLNNYYGSAIQNMTAGKYGLMILMHEIGHAMGLEHPHEGARLAADQDTRQYTLESYNYHGKMGRDEPASFMTYDIAALQEIYGANFDWASGDDVYDYSTANRQIETIWDGGGTDTITAAGSSVGAVIDLNGGAFSSIGTRGARLAADNIAIAYGAVIENAIGTAHADRLIGNAVANVLAGLGGDDILAGGGGSDVFRFAFGSGFDIIEDFENGRDRIDLTATGLGFGALSLAQEASDTRIDFGNDTIVLKDFALAALDLGDFVLA